ncbi:hypothetical protein M3Y97_00445600 [Aphelenchoides bicaudatus]|nr:hypothetical protein M3Y97_00445600 [Aphelenchoides bicaudatus]
MLVGAVPPVKKKAQKPTTAFTGETDIYITYTLEPSQMPTVQTSKLPTSVQPSKLPTSVQPSNASVQTSNAPVTRQTSKLPVTVQTSNAPVTRQTSNAVTVQTSNAPVTVQSTLAPTTAKPIEDYVLTGTILCEQPKNAWLDVGSQVEVVRNDGSVYVKNQTNTYGQFRLRFNQKQLKDKNPAIVLRVQGNQCSGKKLEVNAAVDLSGKQLEYKFGPLLLRSE